MNKDTENSLTGIRNQINTTKKNVDLISNCVDYIEKTFMTDEFKRWTWTVNLTGTMQNKPGIMLTGIMDGMNWISHNAGIYLECTFGKTGPKWKFKDVNVYSFDYRRYSKEINDYNDKIRNVRKISISFIKEITQACEMYHKDINAFRKSVESAIKKNELAKDFI
ncbi:MAG: hypothetical protein J6T10_04015 [Methanobrevibacter sp.]|nr:hypothetical protein [Methanobrevibacter sp.]